MNDYFIEFDEIDWQSKIDGIKFKEYIYENKKLKLVEFNENYLKKIGVPMAI